MHITDESRAALASMLKGVGGRMDMASACMVGSVNHKMWVELEAKGWAVEVTDQLPPRFVPLGVRGYMLTDLGRKEIPAQLGISADEAEPLVPSGIPGVDGYITQTTKAISDLHDEKQEHKGRTDH